MPSAHRWHLPSSQSEPEYISSQPMTADICVMQRLQPIKTLSWLINHFCLFPLQIGEPAQPDSVGRIIRQMLGEWMRFTSFLLLLVMARGIKRSCWLVPKESTQLAHPMKADEIENFLSQPKMCLKSVSSSSYFLLCFLLRHGFLWTPSWESAVALLALQRWARSHICSPRQGSRPVRPPRPPPLSPLLARASLVLPSAFAPPETTKLFTALCFIPERSWGRGCSCLRPFPNTAQHF